jgi:hypothetical protein
MAVAALTVGGVVGMTGCKARQAPAAPEDNAARKTVPAAVPLDPATLGTVSGVVKFAG